MSLVASQYHFAIESRLKDNDGRMDNKDGLASTIFESTYPMDKHMR